jgi:hypothetical protein
MFNIQHLRYYEKNIRVETLIGLRKTRNYEAESLALCTDSCPKRGACDGRPLRKNHATPAKLPGHQNVRASSAEVDTPPCSFASGFVDWIVSPGVTGWLSPLSVIWFWANWQFGASLFLPHAGRGGRARRH